MLLYLQYRKQTLRKKGRFKCAEFEILESIRQNKEKGGCLLGIYKSLDPVLVEEHSEKFELIVNEVKIANKQIRIMTGCRPQEN